MNKLNTLREAKILATIAKTGPLQNTKSFRNYGKANNKQSACQDKMMLKGLSLLLLLNSANALQIKVNGWECKEDAITANFEQICNAENTCYMGQQGSLQGSMTYYGLVDQYGITQDSVVYMDFNMTLAAAGATIYSESIYQLQELAVCDENLNETEGCPYSGNYEFDSNFNLPEINAFEDWAYTGFDGKATIAIYIEQDHKSDILGHCTLILESVSSETQGIRGNAPTGKVTLFAILSGVAAMLLMSIGAFGCACHKQGKTEAVQKVAKAKAVAKEATKKVVDLVSEKATSLRKPGSTDFKLMDDSEIRKSWKSDWDSKALIGTHAAQRSPKKTSKEKGFLDV